MRTPPHISVSAETLTNIGPLPITNSLLTSIVVMLILFLVALWVQLQPTKKGIKRIPIALEMAVEGGYNFFHQVLGDRTDALFPLLFTFFIFILLGNWIGVLPGVSSIGVERMVHGTSELVPFFRGPNADLNSTIALTLISVGITQYLGVKALGLKKYISKFINFSNPAKFIIGLLELVSEFAKLISFSFRLFGNIFAGEVLLLVITFLVPILVPVPFYGLEIFVGFVQALIFTMLTMIFIVVATDKHGL